jgi:hypothetical protein
MGTMEVTGAEGVDQGDTARSAFFFRNLGFESCTGKRERIFRGSGGKTEKKLTPQKLSDVSFSKDERIDIDTCSRYSTNVGTNVDKLTNWVMPTRI